MLIDQAIRQHTAKLHSLKTHQHLTETVWDLDLSARVYHPLPAGRIALIDYMDGGVEIELIKPAQKPQAQ